MRLDESFHMRYTMLQNTLLVTILKRFTETHISGAQNMKKTFEICVFRKTLSCATRVLCQNIMRGSMVFHFYHARLQIGELLPPMPACDNIKNEQFHDDVQTDHGHGRRPVTVNK